MHMILLQCYINSSQHTLELMWHVLHFESKCSKLIARRNKQHVDQFVYQNIIALSKTSLEINYAFHSTTKTNAKSMHDNKTYEAIIGFHHPLRERWVDAKLYASYIAIGVVAMWIRNLLT